MPIGTGLAVGGAVLGAAGSLGANYMTGVSRKKAQKRAFNYGEQAAENAYQRQLDFWNKSQTDNYNQSAKWFNEFESEAAQMKRLRDEGLSPGLFYSGGANSPGASAGLSGSSDSPQGSSYSGEGADYSTSAGQLGVISNILALKRQEAEIENINSDTDKKRRDTKLVDVQEDYLRSQEEANSALTENTRARTYGEQLTNNLAEFSLEYEKNNVHTMWEQNLELLELYCIAVDQSKLEYKFATDTYSDRQEALKNDIKLKASGVALQYALAEAAKKGIDLTDAEIDQLRVSIETELTVGRESKRLSNKRTKKDLDWYNADKVAGYVKGAAQTAIGAIGIKRLGRIKK